MCEFKIFGQQYANAASVGQRMPTCASHGGSNTPSLRSCNLTHGLDAASKLVSTLPLLVPAGSFGTRVVASQRTISRFEGIQGHSSRKWRLHVQMQTQTTNTRVRLQLKSLLHGDLASGFIVPSLRLTDFHRFRLALDNRSSHVLGYSHKDARSPSALCGAVKGSLTETSLQVRRGVRMRRPIRAILLGGLR